MIHGKLAYKPNALFDDAFLRRLQKREPEAWDEFAVELGPRLVRFAYKFFRNVQDAEDTAQEAFMRVYKEIDRVTDAATFRSRCFTICAWLAQSQLRKRRRRASIGALVAAELSDVDMCQEVAREKQMVQEFVDRALARLSDRERHVLHMRYTEGLTYPEIAEVLGIKVSAATMRVKRALDKLRDLANPHFGS